MKLSELTRTSVFHLALVYMALFAASAAILIAFVYWSTVGFLERQTNATIEAEIIGLREQYQQRGLGGLVDVVADRVRRDEEGRAYYLFVDSNLRPLAGNLARWPTGIQIANGWAEFSESDETGAPVPVRARILGVGPNLRLLVGRDIRELEQINRVFREALLLGVGAILVLGLLGGVLMSMSAQHRVARINRTTKQIMAGDLSQRVPTSGGRDEYEELTVNVNAMLGQIEELIGSARHVGDNIAHDLRGPLTRLRNRLELLAGETVTDRKSLSECVEQADALLETFNALLRIARVESGAYRSAFAPVELSQLVRDVGTLFRAAAVERGIAFDCDAGEAVTVIGDRELLAQALSNLLDNAVKYTPEGGAIAVSLIRNSATARVDVRDSGPGISEPERERVLERFQRLDEARSRPGSGLGLTMVKAVVEQHRGELRLEDNAPGLRVVVTLPLPDTSSTALG